ncbi:MAG: hypothetical protein AAF721_41345 [Myxococcota bacterium]
MARRSSTPLRWLSLFTALLAGACASEGEDNSGDGQECVGAKCDVPVGDDEACLARQSEVLVSSQRGFTNDDIRWACADVEGVNTQGKDDRGQEYCEYFAVIEAPAVDEDGEPTGETTVGVDLARNVSCGAPDGGILRDQEACQAIAGCEWSDEFTACVAPFVNVEGDPAISGTTRPAVCREGEEGITCGMTLTEGQDFWLEDNPTEVVGSCVFTTWHSDVRGPLDACPGGECPEDAAIHGIPMTQTYLQMKGSINSNRAAADLVAECFALPELHEASPDKGYIRTPDWSGGDDPLQEPFFRGCVGSNALFGTGWRRSDPSVCAVANRLRECGCTAEGLDGLIEQYKEDNPIVALGTSNPREFEGPFVDLPPGAQAAIVLGDVLLPPQPRDGDEGDVTKRGFELATWDDREGLPAGCRYAKGEDRLRSVVVCDITSTDLRGHLSDPKEFCRSTYGNQVVVHVPVPSAALSCTPPDTDEGGTCSDAPWNIGAEQTGEQTGE